MAGNPQQKLKLLLLLDLLKQYTDADHPLTAEALCDRLAERDIPCERKSIYSDIAILQEYGYDIVCSHTEPRGFFLAYRDFEVPEVCLLCDAVESAAFISTAKSRQLVKKLEGLLSESEAGKLHRGVFLDQRVKSDNEKTYLIIDGLASAIDEMKKVELTYRRRSIENGRLTRSNRKFTVSPYALAWVEDHYYLICNNEKYDNLMHLRVDRIAEAVTTGETARSFREVSEYQTFFDVADYVGKSFNMFGGEPERITFRCENRLLEQMIDRFGEKTPFKPDDADHFTFRTKALVSDGLIGKILQYGGALEVLSPESLREAVAEKIKHLAETYRL